MSCDLRNISLERRGMPNPWSCSIPKVPHTGLGAGCGYHSPAGLTHASGKGSKLPPFWCPCFYWHILDCLMLVILFSLWSLLFLGTNHSFFSCSAMLTTEVGKINHPKSRYPEMPGDFHATCPLNGHQHPRMCQQVHLPVISASGPVGKRDLFPAHERLI